MNGSCCLFWETAENEPNHVCADSTISRLMLNVKDRAKPVVERATRIVEHKSRYRGGVWWGRGGLLEKQTRPVKITQRDTPKPTLPCST